MTTVLVCISAEDFIATMAAMREWLDRHRFEAAAFTYNRNGDTVAVRVGFKAETEAAAFAARFADPEPVAAALAA